MEERIRELEERVKALEEIVDPRSAQLRELLDMQVVGVGKGKCAGCPGEHYHFGCVKVELVGGDYLCLAPLPDSIILESKI